jgi:PAS domain S-box-containing protein
VFDLQKIKEASFEEVLRQIPAAVIVVEAPSGKIIFRNKRAQETREQSSRWARATKLEDAGDFEIFRPDGRPYETEEWPLMRSIRDGEEVTDEEFVYPLADGTGLLLRCNSSPIYNDEGRIIAGVLVAHDVTEQERAEAELGEREERFRATFEQAAVGIAHNALDGRWLRVNQRLCDILGYTREELLQKRFQDITHPDDLEPNLGYTEQLLAGEIGSFSMEKRYIRKDGSIVWGNLTVSLMREPSGDPSYGITVIEDITERKRAEEALRESNGRIENILESITEAFVALDREWRFTYINGRALRRIRRAKGYERTREDLLGKNFWEEFPEAVGTAIYHKYHEAIREQKTIQYETYFPPKDTWHEVHIYPSEEGLSVYSQDITQRKRAEEEVETRTHQQGTVAELGLRALAGTDLKSLMDEAVALVARTLEIEYSEVLEILPGDEELLIVAGVGWEEGIVGNTTVSAGFGSQAGYTLLVNKPVIVEDLRTETRFRPPPLLQEREAVSGMTVVIPGREEPFGVLGAHTKSHRTFSEDDVNFLQAVANVLAAAIQREEAEERVEEGRETERSRIARDLHDEPLQELADALVQAQQIRSLSEDPQQTLRLVRLLATLDRIGPQLRGAIYDLRLEGEQNQLFPELLESLVELHRGMAPESDIALEVHDGVLAGPLGERGRQLLRIIGEALTNVRRHSRARNARVGVGSTEEKLWAEVEDDGRGFDVAEGSEQAVSANGGLGIRGMKERARALGGDLQIESDPEIGTKVRFEVALTPRREEPEEKQGVRILLVEDHATLREALASTFEQETGFEVVGQAGSLAEGREMLEGEEPVDVAVVDLGLPDGYGGDLIKDLREAHPQAQALVLSATLGRSEIAWAVERGAAGVVPKTAHLDEVVDAVRRLRRGETLLPLEEVVELLRFAGSQREEEYEARQAIVKLTPREREVLQALAEGLDSQEISERLKISLRTERNHMANILAKLGVHSQLQALVFALRHGVIEIPS